MQATPTQTAQADPQVPLVVDLDGTLVRSDLLVESVFSHLGEDPLRAPALLAALRGGKAGLKFHIAEATHIDASQLPYDQRVLALVAEARTAGRPVYLASASAARYVGAVATHLGLFDDWFSSSATQNLSSSAKAEILATRLGDGAFDYIGNGRADLAVWSRARRRIAIEPPRSVERELLALDPDAVILKRSGSALRDWIKLLRVHQWAKNALVFVPLVTSQQLDLASIGQALLAFVVFCFAASGIYLVNDLVDLESDRRHLTKRARPLAAGTISVLRALVVAPALVILAVLGAIAINAWFAGVVVAYLALTTAYTFFLKRKMLIDVVTLAMLYTLRVLGGAAAISVAVSEWLLAFSLFMFVSLALIKRYTELAGRLDANLPDPTNRNYRKIDLDIVAALAAAAGFNAVTVFTLYVSSDAVRELYAYPQLLWLICPILIYWVARTIMLAHRRWLHDDPIVFALKDWNSLLAFGLIGAIMLIASGMLTP